MHFLQLLQFCLVILVSIGLSNAQLVMPPSSDPADDLLSATITMAGYASNMPTDLYTMTATPVTSAASSSQTKNHSTITITLVSITDASSSSTKSSSVSKPPPTLSPGTTTVTQNHTVTQTLISTSSSRSNSTAPFSNATTLVIFTTESLTPASTPRSTSTLTSIVTAAPNPASTGGDNIATSPPSLAGNAGVKVAMGGDYAYLSLLGLGVVVMWTALML